MKGFWGWLDASGFFEKVLGTAVTFFDTMLFGRTLLNTVPYKAIFVELFLTKHLIELSLAGCESDILFICVLC